MPAIKFEDAEGDCDPRDAIKPAPAPLCLAELKLWYAVLELAFKDATGKTLHGAVVKEQRGTAQDRDEARLWFRSDNTAPGSFLWVLQATQLPTTALEIRKRVAGVIAERCA